MALTCDGAIALGKRKDGEAEEEDEDPEPEKNLSEEWKNRRPEIQVLLCHIRLHSILQQCFFFVVFFFLVTFVCL